MSTFAHTLTRYWRREYAPKGLSINALARHTGLNPSMVSRLMTGGRVPSQESVGRLADALRLSGVERDELYISAGFVPPHWKYAAPDDLLPAMLVVELLQSPLIATEDRDQFRGLIIALVQQWAARREPCAPLPCVATPTPAG